MNGKASKRIRLAAEPAGKTVKQLKREYLALPYHRRHITGVNVQPHKKAIARLRYILASHSAI